MSKKEAVKKDNTRFTGLQAAALILLTLAICVGGWYMLGKQFLWSDMDMQRVDQQLEYFKQQVNAQPNKPELRISLGYSYYLKGNNDAAIQEFNQALELKKDFYDAYYNLGLVYNDEKRLDDALEMFDKTVQLSPRDYKGHLQKGIIYREMKMYDKALATLNKANDLMPGNADIIYQIGMIAEAKGDLKTAASIYKDALSYDPLFKDAAEGLKRVAKN